MQVRIFTLAIAVMTFGLSATGFAQTDDVVVDGRIITGENYNSAAKGKSAGLNAYGQSFTGGVFVGDGGGSGHVGGVNVLFQDGSVRTAKQSTGKDEVVTKSGNRADGPKLGSLKDMGSIGQLATPHGAGQPASTQNNLKQIGLAVHNHRDASAETGDVNGDGRSDIITGAGSGGGAHVKSGAVGGAGPHAKVFDAQRSTGPNVGGATHVKVFNGGTAQAGTQGRGVFVLSTDRIGPASSSTGAKIK